MSSFKDLTGYRFGKLFVLRMNTRQVAKDGKLKEIVYRCLCDCGNECDISARVLRTNRKKTCGCKSGAKELALLRRTVPAFSKDFSGCPYPTNICKYSRQGQCCHNCSWYEKCDDRCENTPERCVT